MGVETPGENRGVTLATRPLSRSGPVRDPGPALPLSGGPPGDCEYDAYPCQNCMTPETFPVFGQGHTNRATGVRCADGREGLTWRRCSEDVRSSRV